MRSVQEIFGEEYSRFSLLPSNFLLVSPIPEPLSARHTHTPQQTTQ